MILSLQLLRSVYVWYAYMSCLDVCVSANVWSVVYALKHTCVSESWVYIKSKNKNEFVPLPMCGDLLVFSDGATIFTLN